MQASPQSRDILTDADAPPNGHGHHAACIHIPRFTSITDLSGSGVQRLTALAAATGPPLPSAPSGSPASPESQQHLVLRDSTPSEPVFQQVLPVFYTWHWLSYTRADGACSPGGGI